MSIWSGHRWHARVFLRTITPHQGPRIISTWWRSYSGTAEPWSPATPSSRSGTRGGDQGAAKRPRAGELLKQTNWVVLLLWLSWSHTWVTPVLTSYGQNIRTRLPTGGDAST